MQALNDLNPMSPQLCTGFFTCATFSAGHSRSLGAQRSEISRARHPMRRTEKEAEAAQYAGLTAPRFAETLGKILQV
jgi:hypothetical protein